MTAAGKPQSRPARIALTVDLAAGQTLGSYLSALASRNGRGGTAPSAVAVQLAEVKADLATQRAWADAKKK